MTFIPEGEKLTVWVLVRGGDTFFSGFSFGKRQKAEPMATRIFEDAWMFETEEAAAATRNDEPLLSDFQPISVQFKKVTQQ